MELFVLPIQRYSSIVQGEQPRKDSLPVHPETLMNLSFYEIQIPCSHHRRGFSLR